MQRIDITLVTDYRQPGLMEEITVATSIRDVTRWELERARKNWPSQTDAPTLFMLYIAWAALTRTGEINTEFDSFADHVQLATADLEEVDPIRPVAPAIS